MKIPALKAIIIAQLFLVSCVFGQYNFNVLFTNAKTAVNQKKYYEAITKLNTCASIQPENAEIYYYRGLAKYFLEDNLGAEQDFTMAVSNFTPMYYDAFNYRALTRYRLGKFALAVDDLNKVIENNPDLGKLYVERAFFYLADANYKAALENCKKAISLKSLGEDGLLCKAQAEEALSDFDNALSDYNELVRLNPKNFDALTYRGLTKLRMKNNTEAISDFNLAISMDSLGTLAYYCRAEAEVLLEDTAQALKDYNYVLQLEPRNSYAYFGRGVLYANRREYAKSISDFNKVILLNPNHVEALFNRAKLKQTVKDYKGAIEDYDKVTSLFPYFIEAYSNRAVAKLSLKDREGYRKDMETGKAMSDVFHSKNAAQFNQDSLLMNRLSKLSADFHNASDIKPDNVDDNFLPIFYFTEKDSMTYQAKNYSLFLEEVNFKNHLNYCLKNVGAFASDTLLIKSYKKLADDHSYQSRLLKAILLSNIQQFEEAQLIFDSLISIDKSNVMAIFSRGVNLCRQIELENINQDDYYIIESPDQEKHELERKEKCNAALSDFSKVIQLQPDFYFALYNRAYVKCELSDYYGANFDYEQAIKKNPDFAEAYFNNGFLLYYLNLKQAACENFSKAGALGLKQSFSILKKHCSGTLN